MDFRVEADSMGAMRVPADAYYGAQTARAIENFPISGLRFSRRFIRALGLIKKHAAEANAELHQLDPTIALAIAQAADEVARGQWDHEFVIDIFQTGSGTSTNMNANEVIATRAGEILEGSRGSKRVHPNDHVNRGQSSNDVIPTAIHVAAIDGIQAELLPALRALQSALEDKSREFADIIKIGRTHLQDATPIRLGQEFSGYASQVGHGIQRMESAQKHLFELALGGTAVGTGINTHPEFARRTIARLNNATGYTFVEAPNRFEAQAAQDAAVEASGALKTVAVSLIKIANDIRFLASGPRLGYGELKLPATQPGSSIMPGKVNPVMSEMLLQVCGQVIGNDAAITFGGAFGNFELNTMLPLIAHNLLQSIEILARGADVFTRRAIVGLQADHERCEGGVERSLMLVTSLAPVIGYEQSAKLAKLAHETGRTIREVAREQTNLTEAQLTELLDPKRQS